MLDLVNGTFRRREMASLGLSVLIKKKGDRGSVITKHLYLYPAVASGLHAVVNQITPKPPLDVIVTRVLRQQAHDQRTRMLAVAPPRDTMGFAAISTGSQGCHVRTIPRIPLLYKIGLLWPVRPFDIAFAQLFAT
jgi:hypothetical protein